MNDNTNNDSKTLDEKIKAAIAHNQTGTLSEAKIQSWIEASTSNLQSELKQQQEMIESLK